MKLAGKKLSDFIQQPTIGVSAVLLYGPDQGLVREYAKTLAQKCVSRLDDPFAVTELTAAQLKSDSGLLADAAFSMSLAGGDCVIRLSDPPETITETLSYIAEQSASAWPIIIEAKELTPRSGLRKYFEGSSSCAAIACYPEEGRALEGFIKSYLASENLNVDPAAVSYLCASLAGDRQVIRRELEKLSLYALAKENDVGRVTEADVLECIGDSSETSLDNLVFSVGDGNQAAIDQTLTKAFSEGINPVTAIRAVQRHFQRLHFANGIAAQSGGLDQAMSKLRPPVFFKRKADFQRQARNWSSDNLSRALLLASENEIESKTTGLPAEILCSRTLMRIAQAARRR